MSEPQEPSISSTFSQPEAVYSDLFREVPIAVCLINREGYLLEANLAFFDLTGYAEVELHSFNSSTLTAHTTSAPEGDATVLLPGRDDRVLRVNLRWKPVGNSGMTACYLREMPQLGSEKSALEAFESGPDVARDPERGLHDVLELMQLNAVVLDPEARIVFCNAHLLKTTGYSTAELLGANWFDLFSPEEKRAELKAIFRALVSKGEVPSQVEHELVTRDGVKCVIWDSTVLHAPDGTITGAALIGRDITEQRRLEEQFRQAQRLESVGRLAGGIAHDFNNLLTVINGYADTALADLSSFDPLYGMLEEIRRAGNRAASLTRQLLAFSRRQILALRDLKLNTVIGETAPMLRRLIGEDVQLTVDLMHGNSTIKADEGQLQQVIMNLAVNSRDAMPDGGKLTIRTTELEAAAGNSNDLAPGLYVVLAISDTGHGMTEEVRSHVFEPFFTTKPTGKGTGLGLATVYGIVKQSGGHIWFETETGAGTTFYIAFPAVQRPAQAGEETSTQAAQAGNNILIVEDQREVRIFTRMALERAGYRVFEASNGSEALDLVRERSTRIDLVISDIIMPDIGGFRLANMVNGIRPDLPFLFVTGYPDVAPKTPAEQPVHLLQKPFTGQQLIAKVQEALQPA